MFHMIVYHRVLHDNISEFPVFGTMHINEACHFQTHIEVNNVSSRVHLKNTPVL